MTDKEERILIIKITSDPYTCDIGGICKDKVCLETLCEMGITRQKAIDVMAKALCKFISQGECKNKCKECDLDEQEKIFEEILPQHIKFKEQANVMLNAILKGVGVNE